MVHFFHLYCMSYLFGYHCRLIVLLFTHVPKLNRVPFYTFRLMAALHVWIGYIAMFRRANQQTGQLQQPSEPSSSSCNLDVRS